MQQDMLLAQQESINDLKNMVALLLKKKTKKGMESSSKTRSSSKPEGLSNTPPKDKGKRPERTDDENHTNDELVQSSSEGEEGLER